MSSILTRQKRYLQILGILAKHDFSWLLTKMGLLNLVPEAFRKEDQEGRPVAMAEPERIRALFEELGPTFVKMAQILSTRPDLIPKSYIEEFKKLQDRAKALPFEQIKSVIDAEFQTDAFEVFAEIEREPLAAASIGQVHQVVLKDGTKAVIKVQRPNIEDTMRMDIAILQSFAEVAAKAGVLGPIDGPAIVKEFERSILRELDFVVEGRTTDEFRKQHDDDKDLLIPKIFWEYSGKRVLAEELVVGLKISEIEALRSKEHDLKAIARQLVHTVMAQIMKHGLFHADPHPGNIMVLDDGRVAMIDFGMSGRFDPYIRRALFDMMHAITTRDHVKLGDKLLEHGLIDYDVDMRQLRQQIRSLFNAFQGSVEVSEASELLMNFVVKNKIAFPPDLFFLDKVFGTLDGAVKTLDPKLSMRALAADFMPKMATSAVSDIKSKLTEFLLRLVQSDDALLSLPGDLRRVIARVEAGHLNVRPRYSLSEDGLRQVSRLGVKLSLSLLGIVIIAAAVMRGEPDTLLLSSGGAAFGLGTLGLWFGK